MSLLHSANTKCDARKARDEGGFHPLVLFAVGPNKTSAQDALNGPPKTNSSLIRIHVLDLNMRESVRV